MLIEHQGMVKGQSWDVTSYPSGSRATGDSYLHVIYNPSQAKSDSQALQTRHQHTLNKI